MATINTFEDLQVWQKARLLTQKIYSITKQQPFAKDFALRDQIRRASVSIMGNVAEGFEREGSREFIQFLSIAKGSLGELKSYLYVALDQNYIESLAFKELVSLSDEIGRMTGSLMSYLRKSEIKGKKFK
jgi:four helix bundle protein